MMIAHTEALKLAGKFGDAATMVLDPDLAWELHELAGDLLNLANGHPTWLTA